MKAIIIANGRIADAGKLKKYIDKNAYIICADGGYDHAKRMGITPDIVIGDMDSIGCADIDIQEVVYPVRKDYTDSELVMEYAVKKGYDELVLLGFIGTRIDHTFTNISLLCKYHDVDAVIVDEHNEIRLARKENIIKGKKGDIISIVPIGKELCGVTTERLEYPLDNETLYFGEGRGVSNVMTSSECRIAIKSGTGIIIKSTD